MHTTQLPRDRLVRGARDINNERGHQTAQGTLPLLWHRWLQTMCWVLRGTLAASAVVAAIAISALAYCTHGAHKARESLEMANTCPTMR